VATRVILRSSSEDVDCGWTWWWPCFLELEDECSPTIVCVHNCLIIVYSISSPYLLMFGNDHVTRYTEANNVSGGAGDA